MIEMSQSEGVNVVANSGHPGAVKTPLGRNFFEKGTTGKIFLLLSSNRWRSVQYNIDGSCTNLFTIKTKDFHTIINKSTEWHNCSL